MNEQSGTGFDPQQLIVERLERLENQVAQLRDDLDRSEAMGAAGWALSATLLRDLRIEGLVAPERARRIVAAAVGQLRQAYHAETAAAARIWGADSIDLDRLTQWLDAAEHERPAEDLLRRLLVAVDDQPADPA